MPRFQYTAYLPVAERPVNLEEFYFIDFKSLVKNITNDNNITIASSFEELIKKCSRDDISDLCFFDKLYILLTIRLVCISPIIELTVKCPSTKKSFNAEVSIVDILNNLTGRQVPVTEKTYLNDIKLKYSLPKELYVENSESLLKSVIHSITLSDVEYKEIPSDLIERLPASVLQDVNEYIEEATMFLQNIALLKLYSPYDIQAEPITITANMFDGSLIEFLKICFNRDLMSFYKLEYFLMNQFRMTLDSLSKLTAAEVGIYTSLYKEEQAEREKAEKQSNEEQGVSLNDPMPGVA